MALFEKQTTDFYNDFLELICCFLRVRDKESLLCNLLQVEKSRAGGRIYMIDFTLICRNFFYLIKSHLIYNISVLKSTKLKSRRIFQVQLMCFIFISLCTTNQEKKNEGSFSKFSQADQQIWPIQCPKYCTKVTLSFLHFCQNTATI